MIIEINQTRRSGTREFDVLYDKKPVYFGEVPAMSSLSSCRLLRPDGSEVLSTHSTKGFVAGRFLSMFILGLMLAVIVIVVMIFPPEENSKPLIITAIAICVVLPVYFIFIDSRIKIKRNHFKVDCSGNEAAEFYHTSGGFLFMYNVIAFDNFVYKLYDISKGRFEYISIYLGDIQIGQINVDISIYQKRDYVAYLLDDYAALADKLSLFVLYYHSLNYARRREFKYGKEQAWTYSRTNKYYNPSWLNDNFKALIDENNCGEVQK